MSSPDKFLDLSPDEWRQRLSPEEFRILREAGTERPFGEVYEEFHHHGGGAYFCRGCGVRLFTSATRFDSGCGWPSFYDPASIESVRLKVDESHGMRRTEVVCARCGGHLGHVFEGEGYKTPTDQRYCINGTVLEFRPDEAGDDGAPS